jgi:hypothetical protein
LRHHSQSNHSLRLYSERIAFGGAAPDYPIVRGL